MIYRMHYLRTIANRAIFANQHQEVGCHIPISELNPQMLQELEKEDPDLIIEITVTLVNPLPVDEAVRADEKKYACNICSCTNYIGHSFTSKLTQKVTWTRCITCNHFAQDHN